MHHNGLHPSKWGANDYTRQIFKSKGLITWRISARAETECEGCVYTRVLRMRLWTFSPGWNFLSITWGISAWSTGLKISSRVAQTGLKFQPGSPGWNFLHVIANSVLQGFYRKPWMNFQPGQPGWKFIPGWKSPCNQINNYSHYK